jgi:hypothetical protein
MRQIFTILMAIFGLGLILFGSRHLDASFTVRADIGKDRAMEAVYKEAVETAMAHKAGRLEPGKGCNSIPDPGLQRACVPLMQEKGEACHPRGGMSPGCGNEERNDLRAAKRAGNEREITRIRELCEARLKIWTRCALARKNGIPPWEDARDWMTSEKARFNREQQKATDKSTKAFYQRMVGYSDNLLNYYAREAITHEDTYMRANDSVNECKDIIREANR